mmetsp:Transcript_48303/g.35483  ORF Transcript_48303/g.35483 Transcript_48303/m.35483 type:complete len:133 (-) Transcript_48303:43-441(-)
MHYDTNFASGCFYVAVDTLNSFNYMVAELNGFKETKGWYDIGIYTPVKIYGNLIACYEYCNLQSYLNILLQLSSLNIPFALETLVRPIVAAFTEFEPILAALNDAKSAGDFYAQGESFAKILKFFVDGTIAN